MLTVFELKGTSEVWQERTEDKVCNCTPLGRKISIAAFLVRSLHLKWVGRIIQSGN